MKKKDQDHKSQEQQPEEPRLGKMPARHEEEEKEQKKPDRNTEEHSILKRILGQIAGRMRKK